MTVVVAAPSYGAHPYEDHRSHWSYEELAECGFTETLDNPESWVVVYRKPPLP